MKPDASLSVKCAELTLMTLTTLTAEHAAAKLIDPPLAKEYMRDMPTVFENLQGYRFFFFSLDRGEPMHIHQCTFTLPNSAATLNSG